MRSTVAAILLAAGLAGCAAERPGEIATEPASPTASEPAPAPSTGASPAAVPEPPSGTRWVGTGGIVVAVPADWATDTGVCQRPDSDSVLVWTVPAFDHRCPSERLADLSTLTIATAGSGIVDLAERVDLGAEVNGVPISHSGVTCRTSSVGPCSLTFLVEGGDAVFRIQFRGPNPDAFVRGVRDSLRRLPDGFTTVPLVELGVEVDDARRILGDAGLAAEVPEVDWPHYATGTEPAAGSVVEVGSTIAVTIGDG